MKILVLVLAFSVMSSCEKLTPAGSDQSFLHSEYQLKRIRKEATEFIRQQVPKIELLDSLNSLIIEEDSFAIQSLGVQVFPFQLEIGNLIDGGVVIKNEADNASYVILKKLIPMVNPRFRLDSIYKYGFYDRPIDYFRVHDAAMENKIQYILNNSNLDSNIQLYRDGIDSLFKVTLIESQIKFADIKRPDSLSFNNVLDAKIAYHSKESFNNYIVKCIADFKKNVNGNFRNKNYFLYGYGSDHFLLATINEQYKSTEREQLFTQIVYAQKSRCIRIYRFNW